jgi:hypothetical protein
VFFGENELPDSEPIYNLVLFGFTTDSGLHVELMNSFPMIVKTEEKKEFTIQVNSNRRLTNV